MTAPGPSAPHRTHEVENQVPPLEGSNLYATDLPLREAVAREGASWAQAQLEDFGQQLGGEPVTWGRQANAAAPILRAFDRSGNRIDEVEFHPAYHQLMRLGVESGCHGLPWREAREGAHVARAARFYLLGQVEAGVCCPLSMTYAAVPALRVQPELAKEWEPRFTATAYDGRNVPASQKPGALCGMAMTEKQGGSDVRANTTRARPLGKGGPGQPYELTGHKWFCSAPMCDAFLTLANTDAGLTCFLLPRWLPDGTRNRFHLQRLKDKLGNRSNASSEVEFDAAWACMVGEDGKGVRTIIEMVAHTRLDCVIGSASGMRQAVAQAVHHATYRGAFGKPLVDQPAMKNVLADLCLESEAATAVMLRLAAAYDRAQRKPELRPFTRLATAVAKYWVTKRTAPHAAEALECLGGNGYIEESLMPRLYREAPVNSVWEGPGNVICLDVLRTLRKEPASAEAFFAELALAKGGNRHLDQAVDELGQALAVHEDLEPRARRLVERMALALQASLLVRHGAAAVADAFCASRLAGDRGLAFGTLPPYTDFDAIIGRSRPVASTR